MNHTLRCIAFVLVILAGAAACRPAERVTGQSENSASPAAPESPDFVFVSTIEGLYLRETPDMRGKVIALLPFGAEVTPGEETGGLLELQGAKGKWTRVRSEMGEGWVFGAFLRRRSNTSGLITGEYFLGSIFPPSLTIDGRGTFNLRLERHAPSASGDVLIDGTGKTYLLRLDAKTVEFESGGADPEIWRSAALVFAVRSPGHLEYLKDAPSGEKNLIGKKFYIEPPLMLFTKAALTKYIRDRIIDSGDLKAIDVWLSREVIDSLPAQDLAMIRNVIEARSGKSFKGTALNARFRQFEWYKPQDGYNHEYISLMDKFRLQYLTRKLGQRASPLLETDYLELLHYARGNDKSKFHGWFMHTGSEEAPSVTYTFNDDGTFHHEGYQVNTSGDERPGHEEVTGQYKLKGNLLLIRPETYISTESAERNDVVRQTQAARSQTWIELGDLDSFFPSSEHGDFGLMLKTLSFSPKANLFSASESPVLFE
jgi:hypothetical protein